MMTTTTSRLSISLLALILGVISLVSSQELIFVQVLSRHGARYPMKLHPKDHSMVFKDKGLIQQLTSQGKHQHYILGKILYHKYWHLLFGELGTNPQQFLSKIMARSTFKDRAIDSLEAQILGFLEALPPLKLSKQKKGKSLPAFLDAEKYDTQQSDSTQFYVFGKKNKYFHTLSYINQIGAFINFPKGLDYTKYTATPYDEGDFMHKQLKLECPKQEGWIKQNLRSQKMRFIVEHPTIQKFFADLGESIGQKVELKLAAQLIDTYFSLINMGLPHLEMLDQPHNFQIAQFLNKIYFYGRFLLTETQVKVCSSILVDKTLENMKKAIEGSGPKLVLYSSHVTSMSCLFAALKINSFDCIFDEFFHNQKPDQQACLSQYPSYASSIAIELYREGHQHFFKIVYEGTPIRVPLCGNKYLCLFEEFEAFVKGFTSEDPNILCGFDLPTNPLKKIELPPMNESTSKQAGEKISRRQKVYEEFRQKFFIDQE